MVTKDFYELGLKAYNGDEQARVEFFEEFSKIVLPIAPNYGLLPSYVMAKAVIESGYMTDEWNKTLTKLTGKELKAKAQTYNNVFAMNCWKENKEYLDYLPLPAWYDHQASFMDWGPHGYGERLYVEWEPWKAYDSLEDAVEDWCANVRCQSAKHGFAWNPTDLTAQLLATESYTPEGDSDGVREGLHFAWQEAIMRLYETYDLGKYDETIREKPMRVVMNQKNLDEHIRQAYEYAKTNCHYAPCVTYPPMEDGTADCAGLALRALYTMGYLDEGIHNINMVPSLCKAAGMKLSTNIEDVWKYHGVVCFQKDYLSGTPNVSHVYYSLGGPNVNCISKYDLGSNDRIHSSQPFKNVPVDEWVDMHFLMFYYVDNPEPEKFVNKFTGEVLFEAKVRSKYCTARELGRKSSKLLYKIPFGTTVPVYAAVSTTREVRWYYVRYQGKYGWVIKSAFEPSDFKIPKEEVTVTGTPDDSLACRIGAGTEYPLFMPQQSVKNGTKFRVVNHLTAADGSKWCNVYKNKYVYFVSAFYLK